MGTLAEFNRSLDRFEKKVASKIVKDALKAGAKILAPDIKANAPVKTGELRASVKVKAGKRSRRYVSYRVVVTGGTEGQLVGFKVLPTKNNPGNSFIQDTAKADKERVIAEVFSKIKSGITREK